MSRILVVDDDTDILSVMELLFSMKGFEVAIISKGENTFSKIESFRPDLILLDVLISGYDGRTICKKLKSDKQTRHIPVIMFSAHPGAAATISDYGANDFIAKPFEVNHLMKKVNAQLGINSNEESH
ncbi:MAG: response regulator [Bacteroidota bacterium]|nr:response regulator [Bacteroidota bacterium]